MGSNWKTTTLADISERIGDGLHGTPKYSDDGEYYFVNGNNLESGAIVYKDSTKRVGLEEYNKHKKELGSSTLLVSINGTIGNVALYNGEEVVLGKSACYINLKKGIGKEFVKYILSGYLFQEYIQRCSTGSTIKNVSLKMMRDFAFRIPDTEIEQDKAVELLKLLDHKISLNNQTNQTLEQMAQALFKSWFVDFDPVFDNLLASADFKLENLETSLPDELIQKAQRRLAALDSLENAAEIKTSLSALAHELQAQRPKKEATQAAVQILGKTAETPVKANVSANPKILAQHANTHFPNEFEHNEQLGWIPKGWESKTIDELCKINPESWTKKNAPEVVKYVDLANAKNGSVGEAIEYSFSEAPSRARRILRPHDTIIGVVRPANRSFAYVNEDNLTGSTGFAVVRANNQNCRAFAYFSLTNDDCIQEFTRIADGAAYPAIKPEDVAKTYCVYSNNKILDAFESIAGNIMSGVARNQTQTKTLTKLRDTLLPKLIAGEITINKDI
ncbi:restriction endonuclease subunit S [Pseudoalteromonas sp. MER144-MNA-CIBAN-0113]|uniref:restriction endonuclease subunit S n=1 Tax=Pseudoalteromonas sp. MER144-MNA-CIBAN-0113 TaxID=3140429 RepID=UPI00333155CE